MSAAGYLSPISQDTFFALLDYYCNPALDLAALASSSLPSSTSGAQLVIGLETPNVMRDKGKDEPYWMRQPTFRHLYQILSPSSSLAGGGAASTGVTDYAQLLGAAGTLAAAATIVTDGLVDRLSKALSIPPEDIETTKPLHAYGVDSLLAVELRNWFARELGPDVAVFDIMGAKNIGVVGEVVAGKSGLF